MHMKRKTTMAIKGVTRTCALIVGLFLAYGISPAFGSAAGEVLKATPEQFDFGAIPEGEPAVATASIENVGNSPVEIINVRTS